MNNEERIISMLEGMKTDIADLNSKVDVLIGDVSELKEDSAILKEDVAVLKEDVAVLKEDSEVTRYATNKLLDWAERVEKTVSISSSITIPPLHIVE